MNDGDSAGGGHQGRSPAPPAVPDPRSVLSTKHNQISSNTNINATTNASDFNIIPTRNDLQIVNRAISTSIKSPSQTFTQKQSDFQQTISSTSGSAVITSLSSASNQLQHHMQQDSVYYVADIAETVNLSNTQPKPEHIFVTQVQPTQISYLETSSSANISPFQAKRFKIDTITTDNVLGRTGDVSGSLLPTISFRNERPASIISTVSQDINTIKNLIIERKYLRLKSLTEEHSNNVAELFYLQSGGNMMDYPAWKKKPPCQQFVKVSNAYRLDQLVNAEVTTAATPSPAPASSPLATAIGATGNNSTIKRQLTQTDVNKTNPQINSSSLSIIGQPALKRRRSSSSPPNVPIPSSAITARKGSEVLPQGTEIKIPAVGATPVAISTQLPAAVVQLTQQGGTPLVPCCSGTVPTPGLRRNGNDIDEVPIIPPNVAVIEKTGIATVPKLPFTPSDSFTDSQQTTPKPGNDSNNGYSQGDASATGSGYSNSVQEFSFKAKQEVYVMQRISELQREGLWTEKRLPKLQEPNRPKAHWDYLLEEMVWLAADFAQERKWKKNAAKKCARMVQKYFQDKASAAQKAEKAQELHLKRVASFISKEVKIFWSNVEKLVEYKHHTKIEEKRKKALDQHLSFIVDQTEKFSQQLAEGMSKSIADPAAVTSAAPSIDSSRLSSPKKEEIIVSDDEFRPISSSEDDEETIAKADEEAVDVNAEVVALEKESQMDLDDFINNLPDGYLANRDNLVLEEKLKTSDGEGETDDSEFQVNETSDDDEVTISQQEAEESEPDYKKEIDELEADNGLTVEELMEKYRAKQKNNKKLKVTKSSDIEIDSDDDELDSDDASSVSSDNSSKSITEEEIASSSEFDENDKEDGLECLFDDNERNKDNMINDAAAIAESIQPKGNTLSSTNVVTPVPFLLKHSLREYQHIGLDWLVTMHDRKLNGILADEMGLGKTIQTIALLAHLACVKGNWGPHLIVVPSSVMLNWEMEIKKWCPGFKILTYYGTQKERKLKRVGWTKPNAFHICITSYKLVTQDQHSFRRKKWKYLILDEAQNIKNFKSQRWQLLLNFSTERRLLLTGTPLQNDLMELWSLMHFLMPYVFSSHREFKEWFSNPVTGMIEGNMEYNESLINRLHKVIRPFLLRRLKKEVEKQMPKKYEHVVMCRLSNRQRYLYDDFMSRAKTKETLQTGSLLSVINILMQLRKVCNHPNMFEVRPTISPFQMEGISYQAPRLVSDILEYDPTKHINLESLNLILIQLEQTLTAYVSYKSRQLAPPRKLIEEIDSVPDPPPRCPPGRYKFHIRVRDPKIQRDISSHSANHVQVGASPAMKMEGNKLVPLHNLDKGYSGIKSRINSSINPINKSKSDNACSTLITTTSKAASVVNVSTATVPSGQFVIGARNVVNSVGETVTTLHSISTTTSTTTSAKIAKLVQSGKPYFLLTAAGSSSGEAGGGRLTLVCKTASSGGVNKSDGITTSSEYSASLVTALAQKVKTTAELTEAKKSFKLENKLSVEDDALSENDPVYNISEIIKKRKEWRLGNLKFLAVMNKRKSEAVPIYGSDCREVLEKCTAPIKSVSFSNWQTRGYTNCRTAMARKDNWTLSKLLKSYERRFEELWNIFANFLIYVPAVNAPLIRFYTHNLSSSRVQKQRLIENTITKELSPKLKLLHPIISAMTTKFPDPRLIQYDCGKLQTMDLLLRQLKTERHRVLIFTQMTKMLDILEAFLNYHGHIYLRLDGSTRVEQRQALMERFNADKRIFCFILSTRSGGVGINLTGADTVIFYDSDWNPTMDAQAQDRCHRIGQTRDVHIYRLVSEKTIEVNILKKANQKRMLSDMAIEGGNFTTSFFKSSTIKDLFNMDNQEREFDTTNNIKAERVSASNERNAEVESEKQSLRAFESALAAAEDEQDVQATSIAKAEVAADLAEFDENMIIDDTNTENVNGEMSKADLEVLNLVKQLSPIERYAMRFVEETGAAWTAEQLRAAEEELEAQKREWEANRQAALLKEEEMLKQEAMTDEIITYSRKDATNQVNTAPRSLHKYKKLGQFRKVATKQKDLKKRCRPNALKKSSVNISDRNKSKIYKGKLANRKSSIANNGINRILKKDEVIVAKEIVAQDITGATKPIRKTTRTSMAAASEGKEEENISHVNKLSSDIKSRVSDPLEIPTRSHTGVKNQKLLSISKKRKKLFPKCRNAFSSVKKQKGIASQLRKGEHSSSPQRSFARKTNTSRCLRKNQKIQKNTSISSKKQATRNVKKRRKSSSDNSSPLPSSACSEIAHSESEVGPKCENETEEDPIMITNKSTRMKEQTAFEYDSSRSDQAENTQAIDEQTTSNSFDNWNAQAQIQDTATTSSTYYNVSEESDSDDDEESESQLHATMLRKNPAPVSTTRSQRSLICNNANLEVAQENHLDFNSPRTRSRGSVKINLWTLDVSPVLPGVKPQVSKSSKKDVKLDNNGHKDSSNIDEDMRNHNTSNNTKSKNVYSKGNKAGSMKSGVLVSTATSPQKSTKVTTKSRNFEVTKSRNKKPKRSQNDKTSESSGYVNKSNTLHRWLLKTPRQAGHQKIDSELSDSGSEQSDRNSPMHHHRALISNGPS